MRTNGVTATWRQRQHWSWVLRQRTRRKTPRELRGQRLRAVLARDSDNHLPVVPACASVPRTQSQCEHREASDPVRGMTNTISAPISRLVMVINRVCGKCGAHSAVGNWNRRNGHEDVKSHSSCAWCTSCSSRSETGEDPGANSGDPGAAAFLRGFRSRFLCPSARAPPILKPNIVSAF